MDSHSVVPKLSSITTSTGVKVDVLSRQALVTPILRRNEKYKSKSKYYQIYNPNNEKRETDDDLYSCELYNQFKTPFNHLSNESIINNIESQDVSLSSIHFSTQSPIHLLNPLAAPPEVLPSALLSTSPSASRRSASGSPPPLEVST